MNCHQQNRHLLNLFLNHLQHQQCNLENTWMLFKKKIILIMPRTPSNFGCTMKTTYTNNHL